MTGYLVSLFMGLVVGAAYGLVNVPLSGAANDRPRRPARNGARAASGRHGEAPFRAIGSGLHPALFGAMILLNDRIEKAGTISLVPENVGSEVNSINSNLVALLSGAA
jgi:hypothetical protein